MVRFIINEVITALGSAIAFTFQYGQIYYDIRIAGRTTAEIDLHSNMVRFIIQILGEPMGIPISFTFQYGQIYYRTHEENLIYEKDIYIPIWLDLL